MTDTKPNPRTDDLEWSDAEWDAFMDAHQTVIQLKANQTITASDLEDIQLVVGRYEENDEHATEAYDRGYQDGRDNAGGKEMGDLLRKLDRLRSDLATEKGLRRMDAARAAK